MTEITEKYITPGGNNLHIPSRNDFHKYASNLLSDSSFDTTNPTGHEIDRVASALRWTYSNSRKINILGWSANTQGCTLKKSTYETGGIKNA